MIKIILAAVLLFAAGSLSAARGTEYSFGFYSDKEILVGEELTYVVRYGFIELGEVRTRVKSKKVVNGKTYFDAVAYIDSYSSVPFVSLHQIYETTLNENMFSAYFRGLNRLEKYTTYTIYDFDYGKGSVHVKKGKLNPREEWTDSTGVASKEYQDGLSILYYARVNSGKRKSVDVPCMVNEERVSTRINFYSEVSDVSIDAVDYDIACVRLDGETDFVSIFGLTGYFEGWFSNDSASIPIVAKMKVIIGDVTLELKNWKREGWNPPKFSR